MAGVKHIAVWLTIWDTEDKCLKTSDLVRMGFGTHHSVITTLDQLVAKGLLHKTKGTGRENLFFITEDALALLKEEPYIVELIRLSEKLSNEQGFAQVDLSA